MHCYIITISFNVNVYVNTDLLDVSLAVNGPVPGFISPSTNNPVAAVATAAVATAAISSAAAAQSSSTNDSTSVDKLLKASDSTSTPSTKPSGVTNQVAPSQVTLASMLVLLFPPAIYYAIDR